LRVLSSPLPTCCLQSRKALLDTCLTLMEAWRTRKAAEEALIGAAGSGGDHGAPAAQAVAAADTAWAGVGVGHVAAGSFLDLLLSAHARGTGEGLTDEQVRLDWSQQ
jgi:hypothetical protein